jgi:acyl CoA:acetate/3-ketoacid CoA transferase alpha subunit
VLGEYEKTCAAGVMVLSAMFRGALIRRARRGGRGLAFQDAATTTGDSCERYTKTKRALVSDRFYKTDAARMADSGGERAGTVHGTLATGTLRTGSDPTSAHL